MGKSWTSMGIYGKIIERNGKMMEIYGDLWENHGRISMLADFLAKTMGNLDCWILLVNLARTDVEHAGSAHIYILYT